jgi:hypothetical protein
VSWCQIERAARLRHRLGNLLHSSSIFDKIEFSIVTFSIVTFSLLSFSTVNTSKDFHKISSENKTGTKKSIKGKKNGKRERLSTGESEKESRKSILLFILFRVFTSVFIFTVYYLSFFPLFCKFYMFILISYNVEGQTETQEVRNQEDEPEVRDHTESREPNKERLESNQIKIDEVRDQNEHIELTEERDPYSPQL